MPYYQPDVKKLGDKFSITSKLNDYIINPEWKEGYKEFVKNPDRVQSDYGNLWKTINASCENIGASIYHKINNYINNIGNIDTAEIYSLYSMSKVLGYRDSLSYLNFDFPDEILKLINIYSINSNILMQSDNVLARSSIDRLKSATGGIIISPDELNPLGDNPLYVSVGDLELEFDKHFIDSEEYIHNEADVYKSRTGTWYLFKTDIEVWVISDDIYDGNGLPMNALIAGNIA